MTKQHLGVLIRPHVVPINVFVKCRAKEAVHIDVEKAYVVFHSLSVKKITLFDVTLGKVDLELSLWQHTDEALQEQLLYQGNFALPLSGSSTVPLCVCGSKTSQVS